MWKIIFPWGSGRSRQLTALTFLWRSRLLTALTVLRQLRRLGWGTSPPPNHPEAVGAVNRPNCLDCPGCHVALASCPKIYFLLNIFYLFYNCWRYLEQLLILCKYHPEMDIYPPWKGLSMIMSLWKCVKFKNELFLKFSEPAIVFITKSRMSL